MEVEDIYTGGIYIVSLSSHATVDTLPSAFEVSSAFPPVDAVGERGRQGGMDGGDGEIGATTPDQPPCDDVVLEVPIVRDPRHSHPHDHRDSKHHHRRRIPHQHPEPPTEVVGGAKRGRVWDRNEEHALPSGDPRHHS